MDGENSANWIIGRISAYAEAVSDPFSYYELMLLRKSIDFFNETNRADFLSLNKRCVRMIRETIEDEKLDGMECVEARTGLFIPIAWQKNYLEVYESGLGWMISHCAQSAMMFDPTIGESEPWQSPRVLSGFRDSVVKTKLKSVPAPINSLDEFDSLNNSFRNFLFCNEFISKCMKLIGTILGTDIDGFGGSSISARTDLLGVICAYGDIDDDVTAAWILCLLSNEYLSNEIDDRELLRSFTRIGGSSVLPKSRLLSEGLAAQKIASTPSAYFLDLVLVFDFMLLQLGVKPIGTMLHAVRSMEVAIAVNRSTIFSRQPSEVANSAIFASTLLQRIRIVDSFNAEQKSIDDLVREVSKYAAVSLDIDDVKAMMKYAELLEGDFLSDWMTGFVERLTSLRS